MRKLGSKKTGNGLKLNLCIQFQNACDVHLKIVVSKTTVTDVINVIYKFNIV